ncbi:helix-turn-helix domain-containing protein [Clostridium sp. BJN0001]|uniref:helix-turn-helix domain-containing protein n=1 Tax=Clostridium sp. BJN0001 TaxID=2930219 RepID=UPI001FD2206C|nr:helix-turn-helix domain-containing protein [Clostridium sp. BJN0001]
MENIDIIQESIDYIEQNLKENLNAEVLAKRAAFSVFYYYRIFQSVVGVPVMQYIQKRKLLNLIYEIGIGRPMLIVESEYGFETHSGFYKAFKKEFGCSPTTYLNLHKPKKPYKMNLKQEEHIMITHKKLKSILEKWNIDLPVIIEDIYYSNEERATNCWKINKRFIIKAGTNIERLRQHINVSRLLVEAGLLASLPIKTKYDSDYYIEDELYFCLMKPVQGTMMNSKEIFNDEQYKEKARYIGEIIAQLHKVIKNYENKIAFNSPNIYNNVSEWAIPIIKNSSEIPYKFYDEYKTIFGQIYPKLPKQIIHRDPNLRNIIVNDEKIAGFIDFELSEKNIRIYDPCYAATSILSEIFNEGKNVEKWFDIYENIILGYDNVCNLTIEEKKALPYVVLSNQMICYAYFSELDKFEELKSINKDMTLWLYKNIKRLDVF